MPTETVIDILRHGECEGGNIYRGSTDVALTEQGWSQMHNSATQVSAQWQHLVSSPLQRCKHFSAELAQQQDIPHQVVDGYRETYFGDWEGREIEEVWTQDRAAVEAWYKDPMLTSPPNGEPTAAFAERVVAAFEQMLSQHKNKHIGLVIHGGVIRALLAHVLSIPLSGFGVFDVPYACLSRVKVMHSDYGDFKQLVFHNLARS